MSHAFHAEAKAELIAAVDWYESRLAGLGKDFAVEVRKAIQRAEAMPEMWPPIAPELRRVLVHRFPYAIIYSVEKEHVLVFAIAHTRRAPDYWLERTAPMEPKASR